MNVYDEIAKIAELIADAHEVVAYHQFHKKKLPQNSKTKSKAKKNYMQNKVKTNKKNKKYRRRWKEQLTNKK